MSSSQIDSAVVLCAPQAHVVGPVTGVAELDEMSCLMARFTNGSAHAERRRIVVDALAPLDETALRAEARARMSAALAGEGNPDLTALARRVVVATLASAIGFTQVDEVVDAVAVIASALAPRADRVVSSADSVRSAIVTLDSAAPAAAVADRLSQANLIAALFQAVDATAGLVTNALQRAATVPTDRSDVERLVDGTLSVDPPVQRTRRLLEPSGEVVVVPLTGDGLAFGAGMHECPGRREARALACGIVEVVLAMGGVVGESPTYEDRWNLRIVDQQRLRRR